MDIDQTIHQYHEYTPKEFLLYCHKNATLEGGLSTLIDCTMAPLTLHGNKRKALRETTLSYQVKLSYFGGIERNYPLIMEAPGTHKEVLRWWQMWDEENNPGGVQFNYSRILESSTYTDMSALEHELTSLSLQEANHFAVEFQTGDITLINNHTMLHGRTAFKGHRELWRIQLQPEHRANANNSSGQYADSGRRSARVGRQAFCALHPGQGSRCYSGQATLCGAGGWT